VSAPGAPVVVVLGEGGFTLEGDVEPGSTETQAPTPAPMREDLEETDVSPGLPGFLAIFAVALVTVALLLSMTRKLRGVNHRAGTEPTVTATFEDRGAPGPSGEAPGQGTARPADPSGDPGEDRP